MALQGDLKSFALPDVLRLLAGTAKSGLLEVAGPGTAGELSLERGGILHGSVSTAPHAEHAAEVVFELLRLDEGSFAFAEGDSTGQGPTTDVEFALEQAEALVQEWAAVEVVVPSMDAWVSLAAELVGEGVHLRAAQWQTIVAIAGGGSVRDLAASLGLSDLDACRAVMDLAETGLVEVRASHAAVSPAAELRSFDEFEPFQPFDASGTETGEPVGMTELEDLVVEDRPVVMEESDDALLPEPLPGEGVAYDGSDLTGVVDGRYTPDHGARVSDTPLDDAAAAFAAFDDLSGDSFGGITYEDEAGDAAPFPTGALADEPASMTSDEANGFDADEVDDERGSLLKFLSTVKP